MANIIETLWFRLNDFLLTDILVNKYIYFDLWSIVHLFFGMLIMYIIISNKFKRPYLLLFLLVAGFEIVEFTTGSTILSRFSLKEIPADIVWDMIFGMLGGYIYERNKSKKLKS